MKKEIYLVHGDATESYQDFRQRIFTAVTELNATFQPEWIKFTITEKAPPAISIIPFSRKKLAAISVGKITVEGATALKSMAGFHGAYRVDEVLPVSYQKTWNDGEPTPGVCLLTLFSKRKGIDYSTFLDRWHNGHTPLSLRIHPLWNYVRNEVKEILSAGAPALNGIVEEQMKTASDLLNPFKFFGNPVVIIPRMMTVYADTKSFIDYDSMETYLAMENWIRSK